MYDWYTQELIRWLEEQERARKRAHSHQQLPLPQTCLLRRGAYHLGCWLLRVSRWLVCYGQMDDSVVWIPTRRIYTSSKQPGNGQ